MEFPQERRLKLRHLGTLLGYPIIYKRQLHHQNFGPQHIRILRKMHKIYGRVASESEFGNLRKHHTTSSQ
jgi:hypothetical protein